MLDVIGAGATAHTKIDWYSAWLKSPEQQVMDSELQEIIRGGNETPAIKEKCQTEFSASFGVQLRELTRRAFVNYYRNPTYLISKYVINIFAGKCRNYDMSVRRTDSHNRVVHWLYVLQSKTHCTRGTEPRVSCLHGCHCFSGTFQHVTRAIPSLPASLHFCNVSDYVTVVM